MLGGSRGAGYAIARALLARGAAVGIVASSHVGVDDAVARLGGEATGFRADVGDRRQLEAAVAAFAASGAIDLLVCAAAVPGSGAFVEQDPATLKRLIDVNVGGLVHATRIVLPAMIERGSGHVVVMGCHTGLHGVPGMAVYGATRMAAANLAGALALELAGTGVGVSCIVPSELGTGLHASEIDRLPAWMRTREGADPDALAGVVLSAVERDALMTFFPAGGEVAMRARFAGFAPRAFDFLLRQLRGPGIAPHRAGDPVQANQPMPVPHPLRTARADPSTGLLDEVHSVAAGPLRVERRRWMRSGQTDLARDAAFDRETLRAAERRAQRDADLATAPRPGSHAAAPIHAEPRDEFRTNPGEVA